jgi:polysaccharide biosynthesis protein PslG
MLRLWRKGGRVSRALFAFLVTAFLAAALTPVANAVPAKFWGVVPQSLPTSEQFATIKRGGVDSIRIPIFWAGVQPKPSAGAFLEWTGVDRAIRGAAQAGVDVLPYIYGAPSWAVPSAPVPGTHGAASAPRNLPVTGSARAAWVAFLQLVVARYGPNGAFWAENPGLTPRPIRTWQIWNEENFKYFVVRPNPTEYGKLVKTSSAAIKSVDPGAKILLGGLFARPKEAEFKVKPPQAYFASDFLAKMYKGTPGIKSRFSGISLHPYTSDYRNLTPDIEEIRAVLKANGDASKGLWITELGWSSEAPNPADSFAKGVRGQVKQLKGGFSVLIRNQVKWRLRGVYWFSLEDGPPAACNFCGGAGLFGPGFAQKPSWRAYVKFAAGQL